MKLKDSVTIQELETLGFKIMGEWTYIVKDQADLTIDKERKIELWVWNDLDICYIPDILIDMFERGMIERG